jgi:hypothetical protein
LCRINLFLREKPTYAGMPRVPPGEVYPPGTMSGPDQRLAVLRDFAASLSSLLPGAPRVHAVLGFTVPEGQQVHVVLSHPGGEDRLVRAFVPWTTAHPCVLYVVGVRAEAVSADGVEKALRESLAEGGLLASRMRAWASVLPG